MAPDFAAAWGFLAFLRTLQIVPFHDPDGRPEHTAAVAAARRALSLDPDCADAVLASNAVLPAFSNYEEKLKNSARAALLAPSDASTLSTRAFALTSVGHVRDALAIYRRAVEVEPNVPWLHAQYALAMTAAGQVDEGMALINDIHRQGHPNQWIPLSRAFSLTYLAAKDERLTDEALASLEEAPSESQVPDMMTVAIARIKAVLRGMLQAKPLEHDAREQTLEAILSSGPEQAVNISFCQIAAAMGHAHLGLRLLHAALDNGRSIFGVGGGRHNAAMHLFYLHASPLCARLGLAQFWQTSSKWPDCADEVPYDFKAECERAANALR
jgi:tetratricopeptide (TPR) repeat protein